mgnify:CR=1 FL=1
MYTIYVDNELLYYPGTSLYEVVNPTLSLEVNSAGTLTLSVPSINPLYDSFAIQKSIVSVFQDGEEIFRGRVIEISMDWDNMKRIECEGELAYLCDTIMRQAEYHEASVAALFRKYVEYHNGWIYADRRFEVGQCTVTSTETSIFRYTNYQSTWTEMKEDFLDNYGGYFRVRYDGEHRYLDYLSTYDHEASQKIEFGSNLLDYVSTKDGLEIFTRLIPLGATLDEEDRTWRAVDGLEEYLTIRNVNSGDDWLDAPAAIKERFGVITRVMHWDDVHDASILKTKAQAVINSIDLDAVCIEVKAIDLHLADKLIESFRIGDMVTVKSVPHNLEETMMITKINIAMDKPSESLITIGKSPASLSEIVGKER